jgi:hypothetical protein
MVSANARNRQGRAGVLADGHRNLSFQVKRTLLISLLAISVHAQEFNPDKIADAIYRAEGGAHTRWPYGIKSVITANPRRVCLNTIHHNWQCWRKAGCPGDFIDFLADRYCPASADPIGNANWKRNVKFFLK